MMHLRIWLTAGAMCFALVSLGSKSASAVSRNVWDLQTIKTMPLDVEVVTETRSSREGKEYLEREVLYTSQVTAGKPVRALAYLTVPLDVEGPVPAMVSIRSKHFMASSICPTL